MEVRRVLAAASWWGAIVAGVAAVTVSEAWAAARIVHLAPESPAREVNRYFSPLAHGPTKKFYSLPESRIVVVVSTADGTADASATIHVFGPAATAEAIDKWINNQHSDALFADAAEPQRSIEVPAARFHARPGAAVDHEVGERGDEYDRVRVDFTIDAFTDGDVEVRASRGSLDAFVRTKQPAAP